MNTCTVGIQTQKQRRRPGDCTAEVEHGESAGFVFVRGVRVMHHHLALLIAQRRRGVRCGMREKKDCQTVAISTGGVRCDAADDTHLASLSSQKPQLQREKESAPASQRCL